VPENTLKFVVGVMLTSFGAFWGAEGAGATWPDSDLSLLVMIPSVTVFALLIVLVLRFRRASVQNAMDTTAVRLDALVTVGLTRDSVDPEGAAAASVPQRSVDAPASVQAPDPELAMQHNRVTAQLKQIGLFWYDFVIGDDWQIAAGVALGFAVTFWFSLISPLAWAVGPVLVALLLPWGVRRALR
jgi:uncharacterized membrane protein